jgi:hypothetical protein
VLNTDVNLVVSPAFYREKRCGEIPVRQCIGEWVHADGILPIVSGFILSVSQ